MSNSKELPGDTLFRMITGFRNTQTLYVVAKLGVADLLINGPVDSSTLAQKLNVHPRSLFRVMRALAGQGVFTQDRSNCFGLTSIGQLLRTDNPHTLRYAAIEFGEENYRAAGELLYTVKTGETAFDHVYGMGRWDFLGKNPEASKTCNLFMASSQARFPNPFEFYNFKDRHLIVDVGGGRGHVIAGIMKLNSNLKGILFDLPQGVAEARSFLTSEGIDQRCQIVTGSFFDSVPAGGDLYLLSRILHDWQDQEAKLILDNCRKAIRDDGILLLRENVIPEGDTPHAGKQLDISMLYMVGGAERTEEEWSRLLQDSRFKLNRIIKTGQPFDLIEARPLHR
jgi:O-methyltransferase/methyltransferase family protein